MKLSKEKQQQLIAVLVGAVLVIVALYLLVITGQQAKIAKLDRDLSDAQNLVSRAERDIKDEKIKLEMLAEATNQLAELERNLMPSNQVYSIFINLFQQFRAQYGGRVEIVGIDRDRPAPLGMLNKFPYGTAVFTVRGQAYYHDFGRFLADFETQFPYMRVRNFTLNAGTLETAGSEKLSFEMDIVVLVKPNL
jgi:hypothetical protein